MKHQPYCTSQLMMKCIVSMPHLDTLWQMALHLQLSNIGGYCTPMNIVSYIDNDTLLSIENFHN